MGKLEGKIALVTGGNSGIGLASAKRFVDEGAYVFITGRRDRELAAAVKEIGRNVTAVQGDVSNLGDLDRLFAQIKREKGRLDIVFANAGTAQLVCGLEGQAHSRERGERRLYRYAWIGRPAGGFRRRRRAPQGDFEHRSARQVRYARRDCESRGVSRFR